MENLNGSEIVLKALSDQGVEVVFGYPGGAVLPIYDSLFKQNSIKHILVREEAGAIHAAEGYAKSSGKVGVVLSSMLVILFFFGVSLIMLSGTGDLHQPTTKFSEGSVYSLGEALFTKFLLPFEVASLLLLVALIGTVYLAKKKI